VGRKGFSLVECLVFIACCSMLSLAITTFIVRYVAVVNRATSFLGAQHTLFLVAERVAADIGAARMQVGRWHTGAQQWGFVAFGTVEGERYQAWGFTGRRVWRFEDGVRVTVADGIDQFDLLLDVAKNRVKGVWITVGKGRCVMKWYMPVYESLRA